MGALELGRGADRYSGKASGSAMRLRLREQYVLVGTPNLTNSSAPDTP